MLGRTAIIQKAPTGSAAPAGPPAGTLMVTWMPGDVPVVGSVKRDRLRRQVDRLLALPDAQEQRIRVVDVSAGRGGFSVTVLSLLL